MSSSEKILANLKKSGLRITTPRKRILQVLEASNTPLNPYQIAEKIKIKDGADVSTVYRFLEVLKKMNLVHFIKENRGYVTCRETQCSNSNHCHHQFICKECGNIEELHFADKNFFDFVQNKYKNLIFEEHYLEFSGKCGKCALKIQPKDLPQKQG